MPNYSPKLTFGPDVADWQERLNPERMRQQRMARAQTIMKKHGVAALLDANHHNIRYLTALRGFTYPMCRYVLFFAEHDPVMYEHNGYYHQMPDQCPWIKEWRPAHSWLTGSPGPEASADEAKAFAGRGSLIPRGQTYAQHLQHFRYQCDASGIHNVHGHRHLYAQIRYRELTGWAAPAAGGPTSKSLTGIQKAVDREARLIISRELGHAREQIVGIYCGK